MNAYIKKTERSQINGLTLHLKNLEKNKRIEDQKNNQKDQ